MKKWLIGIIVILVLAVGVLAWLNGDRVAEKKKIEEDAAFVVKLQDDSVTYHLSDLKEMGPDTFSAVLKTNGKDPINYEYEGVELRKVLSAAGIDVAQYDTVILTAIDGYSVAYSAEEVLQEKNVYLVYAREGELLETGENGGRGPYQTIVASDQFSNRRCKFAVEVEVR
ncbi:molybdopterin-dependent oxidoreductase [Clostridia bacterium]|nr:molybdopterin-dependent oxidoreductase [Clostridia bacterium]